MLDKHSPKPVRRHAAIVFTDIVGYTAMMGNDEDQALEILSKNGDIHQEEVKKFGGKIIKEIGDGMLISFELASDAVYCALSIQIKAKKQNIPLKIGIHEGEILFKGKDVLGDGVNVAARLQEISQVGCITISNSVYRDVKNKPGIETELVGEQKLKNVDEPIKVYKVICRDGMVVGKGRKSRLSVTFTKRYQIMLGSIIFTVIAVLLIWYMVDRDNKRILERTVAVLPFHDDSPTGNNTYFCNGMMEEILNHLEKIKDLQVKSRTSVEQYRKPSRDIIAIGKELNVAFLLEGSVRKYNDDLRITAQLIDAKSGNHLWSEVYDGKYTDAIFEFQSNIAKRIALSMNAIITPQEQSIIDLKPTRNMEAYDLLRQASFENKSYWKSMDRQHLVKARKLVTEALKIDTTYIWAMALKGDILNGIGDYDSAFFYANKALALDPEFSWAYGTRGEYYRFTGQFDLAIENFKKAINNYNDRGLSGNGKWYEFLIGFIYCMEKDNYSEGLPYLEQGFDIKSINGASECMMLGIVFSNKADFIRAENYLNKMIGIEVSCNGIANYAMTLFFQSKNEEIFSFLDTLCDQVSCWPICYRMRFFSKTQMKSFVEAEDNYKKYISVGGQSSTADSLLLAYVYLNIEKQAIGIEILKKVEESYKRQLADNNNWRTNFYLSLNYALLDNKTLSYKHLRDMIKQPSPPGFYKMIGASPIFEKWKNDPEYINLKNQAIDKMEDIRNELENIIEREGITL